MKINIFICDDHQLFIDGIKSILSHELQIQIVGEANNGMQAIQRLNEGLLVDVLLLDIRMPILDGMSTALEVKKKFPQIRILTLSMYDQASDVKDMLRAGADGYIIKNAGKIEMIKAIKTLAEGRKYISPSLAKEMNDLEFQLPAVTKLSKREKEIIQLILKGNTSSRIAELLFISKHTVDSHRKNIYKKLAVDNVAEMIKVVNMLHPNLIA